MYATHRIDISSKARIGLRSKSRRHDTQDRQDKRHHALQREHLQNHLQQEYAIS